MKDSNSSQKIKAPLLIVLLTGALLFWYSQDENQGDDISDKNTVTLKPRPRPVKKEVTSPTEEMTETQEKNGNPETNTATDVAPPRVYKSPEAVLEDFKKLAELDFKTPEGFKFYKLEFDKIAGIASHDDNEGLAILAAPFKASVDQVIQFIRNDKADFKFLKSQDFSSTGDLKYLEPPQNSGISRITVIPGGEFNGHSSFATLIERVDGRGIYLFILRSPNSYENLKPQINEVVSSLKTRK
jgi:hypothetical protein